MLVDITPCTSLGRNCESIVSAWNQLDLAQVEMLYATICGLNMVEELVFLPQTLHKINNVNNF